ncbi:TetR/AcrR family transcriptional regulator [Propionicicella superfundia]|uniref:TetR/AcrR family transcriptional regulator n=1 Tax=Propionicicella superfundia TaxID=348582 RepID=UPI0003FAF610|nr:TetR/AcrR family transcriptional regulator [Propionicicella superfundia]
MSDPAGSVGGRRVRNMQDKHDRIFRAASELFAERGFGDVSTQEVSNRADVAAGTLFRYAASKGELLLMVLNEELRGALEVGERRAASEPDTVEAIFHMVEPILERASLMPENSVVYQRELLFGPSNERHRAEGLALVAGLEARIAARLRAEAQSRGLLPDPDRAVLAGAAVFAVAHLAVARFSTGAHPGRDLRTDLREQIRLSTNGYLAGLPRSTTRRPVPSHEPRPGDAPTTSNATTPGSGIA